MMKHIISFFSIVWISLNTQAKNTFPDKPVLTLLADGTFMMGSSVEKGKTQYTVSVSRNKKIKYPVMVSQYKKYCITKAEKKMFSDLNFKETVDAINIKIAKWTEKSNSVKLKATEDGNILLTNDKQLRFYFNIFELKSSSNARNEGIEIRPCDSRTHAPSSLMSFMSNDKSLAFIRFTCSTPAIELEIIKRAFLNLKNLCKRVNYKPNEEAKFFVGRYATIKTNSLLLKESIRAVEQKPKGDTITFIESNGEGWLDKDSIPTGNWKFYATNSLGKEYLFKTGDYEITVPSMFEITGIDIEEIEERFKISVSFLKQRHLEIIPFIKTGTWNYYHESNIIWKTVEFKNVSIPIELREMINDMENPQNTSLMVGVKDDKMDEWVDD